MTNVQIKLTEFSDLITRYTADFVGRGWLVEQVNALIENPDCRFVVLTGGPGVGKTAFLAHLAATHPQWPRYFIRRDSRDLLRPGDANTFLLTIGGQLATLYPHLFHPENLEVVVRQRIGSVEADGEARGARIEELHTSPFYRVALRVEQEIRQVAGKATALEIGRLVTEPRLLQMQDLQYLGLLDPARLLAKTDPEMRIVVLVDALDELRYSPAEADILRVLREMPEVPFNLRFVISSRPEAFLGRLLTRSDARELTLDVAGADNQADLRAYAEGALTGDGLEPVLAEAGLNSAFVEGLLGKAAGNFLYLKSVLGGIQQALKDPAKRNQLSHFLCVEELPDDLNALYGYFLASVVDWAERRGFGEMAWKGFLRATLRDRFGSHRLLSGNEAAWRRYLSPLLGVLAAAQEPLSEEQLIALTGLKHGAIRDLLRELRQFIETIEGQRLAYRIYHTSFAEYLLDSGRNRDYCINGQEIHHCIANYYLADSSRWLKHGCYALRHLSTHLTKGNMLEELGALVERREWYEAQRAYDPSFRFYANDVERAIEGIEEQREKSLSRVVAWSFLYGTLGSWAANVPTAALETLIALGKTSQALSYAALIADPRIQTEAYHRIGLGLLNQRQTTQARDALVKALTAAESIQDESSCARAMAKVTVSIAQAGELDLALSATEKIRDDICLAWVLVHVAESLSEVGRWKEFRKVLTRALAVVKNIEEKQEQVTALQKVILVTAYAGDFEQAITMANSLWPEGSYAEALAKVVSAMARAEKFDLALSTAESIQDNIFWYVGALVDVADSLTGAGKAEEASELLTRALKVTESIEKEHERLEALGGITVALARTGDLEKAAEVLTSVLTMADNPLGDLYTPELIAIAKDLTKAGMVTGAQKTLECTLALAREIPSSRFRTKFLADVARTMAEIGQVAKSRKVLDHALVKTELFGWDPWCVETWIDLAEAMIQTGYWKGITRALAVAEGLTEYQYLDAQAGIALALARAGEKKKAQEVLNLLLSLSRRRQIDTFGAWPWATMHMAEALVQAGEFECALEALERFWDDPPLTREVDELLEHTLRDFKAGIQLAYTDTLWDESWYCSVLVKAAQGLAQLDDAWRARKLLSRALEAAERIRDDDHRAEALTGLVEAMAQIRDTARALALAYDIQDVRYRALALICVARALAQGGKVKKAQSILRHALAAIEDTQDDNLIESAQVLVGLAGAVAQVGRTEDAWEILTCILEENMDRAWGLFASAMAEGMKRDPEMLAESLAMFKDVKDESRRASGLILLAQVLAQTEDQEGLDLVAAVTESIQDERYRAWTLAGVAQALAQVADRKCLMRVLRMAARLRRSDERDRALSSIVPVVAQIGDYERALSTFEDIQDERCRAEALASIAQAMARASAENVQEVLVRIKVAAEGIQDEDNRIWVLAGVADALHQTGDIDGAQDVLARALLAAKSIRDNECRADALAHLANILAQAGDFERALEAAECIPRDLGYTPLVGVGGLVRVRINALISVLQVLSQAKGFSYALKVAEGIRDDIERAWILIGVTETLAQMTYPGNQQAVQQLATAFQAARSKGRREVLWHIAAFAPVLEKLDVIASTWKHIQAVEALLSQ